MGVEVKWRKPYDVVRDAEEREATNIVCDDPSLTQQHFAIDADINVLVERFRMDKTPLPVGVVDPRYYGDVSEAPDLRTMLDRVRDATAHFNALPVKLRNRFDNSPAKLWSFIIDPANVDEAVSLGILVKPDESAGEPPPDASSSESSG